MTKKKLKQIFFPLINSFLFIFFISCGFGFDSPLSTFDAQGPVAQLQKDLFLFVFWLAVIVFFLVEGAILYASYKYRQKDEKLPAQIHGNTKLELMWTVLPSIIIVIIAVPTVMGIWKTQVMPDEDNSLIVDSIGHQWWFEFRYPQEEIVTANELHIPENKDVIVNIESQDVIHSFWIPKIAGKIDMVPNHQNKLWIKADNPGIYYIKLIAESYCGTSSKTDSIVVLPGPDSVQFVINDSVMCPDCPTDICLGDSVLVSAIVFGPPATASIRYDTCADGTVDTIQVPAGDTNFTYDWCFSWNLNTNNCDPGYTVNSGSDSTAEWVYDDSCGIYNIYDLIVTEWGWGEYQIIYIKSSTSRCMIYSPNYRFKNPNIEF